MNDLQVKKGYTAWMSYMKELGEKSAKTLARPSLGGIKKINDIKMYTSIISLIIFEKKML